MCMQTSLRRRTAESLIHSYISLMKALVCIVPLVGVTIFLMFTDSETEYRRYGFHEFNATLSVLISAVLSFISFRGYARTRSPFIYYVSIGFMAYAILTAPYGIFARWSDFNPVLFGIFGPVSRLVVASYLLVGVLHLGESETRKRIDHRGSHALFAFMLACGLTASAVWFPIERSLLNLLEYSAALISLGSVAVIALSRVRTTLMNYHLVAQAFFVQASIAFLLGTPWNAMWWFAHTISAAGFLILGYAVATAYRYGRSFETIYNDTIYYKWRVRELARMNEALKTEIQERKRAEAEADELRREAEQTSRLKDEFLATLSHELRTPANVILGFSELLQTDELNKREQADAAGAIYRNAKAQTELINQLLDVSRIITGKMVLKREKVNLNEVARSVTESAQLAAIAKSISIRLDLPQVATFVWGDSGRIQQILWNLISNAIKFTPGGGTVSVKLTAENSNAVICVADSGEGISPGFMPHLFEKFSQQDGSRTRRHGGLGLGLAIVRHLTELHGGTVSASSEGVGRGARFYVSLPLAEQMPVAVPAAQPADATLKPLQDLRVLVVDDAPDVLGLVATILRKFGARVETASSASQALERLKHIHPDVLLSDISMPGEDGYTLIKKIRQLNEEWARRVPAAALTAFAAEEDKAAAVRAGFQMHIAKPVDTRHLVEAVQRLSRTRDQRFA
ncbi:MAG TPA: ATP-binding protein [Bdellovibrionales bacterium]|nr:ATP-binding protein [Bdellovibrionales bacterium]